MLVIRLARTGRKKYPTYRVVVADSRRASTGKFVDSLGHYNPHTKDLVLETAEVQKYLKNGAQPSNSVIKLLQREKFEMPQWVQVKERAVRPPKKAPIKKPAPAGEPTKSEVPEPKGDDTRVAKAATENAAVTESAQESVDLTETADKGEAQAEAAADAQTAAADAATEAAADKTDA